MGMLQGKVIAVRERNVGTELAAGAAAGERSLDVEDVEVLDVEGGTLTVGFEIADYTVDEAPDPSVDELALDDPPDAEGGTVRLAAPLVDDHVEGERVLLYPRSVEKEALVDVEGLPEPIPALIEVDDLRDRLVSRTRGEDDAETVAIVDVGGQWYVTSMISEPAAGFVRGYDERDGVVAAGSQSAPAVLCTVKLDIPSTAHRVLMWYFAGLDAGGVSTDVVLGFDDGGVDFNVGEHRLAQYVPGAFSGRHDATPLIPQLGQDNAYVRNDFTLGLTAQMDATPAAFMPYSEALPTVGLHEFRLVLWKTGPAVATATDAKLWAVVI